MTDIHRGESKLLLLLHPTELRLPKGVCTEADDAVMNEGDEDGAQQDTHPLLRITGLRSRHKAF